MTRIVLAASWLALALGCSDKATSTSGIACEQPVTQTYSEPGCGTEAHATCLTPGPHDACASIFCSCQGQTIYGGCGYAVEPFASRGACPDAGPPDTGPPPSDGSLTDGIVLVDGVACMAPVQPAYDQPGCGAAAHPSCVPPFVADSGCVTQRCSCQGVTVLGGCSYSLEPYAASGPCPADGGAGQ